MSRWELCTTFVTVGAPLEDVSGARVTSLDLEVVRPRARIWLCIKTPTQTKSNEQCSPYRLEMSNTDGEVKYPTRVQALGLELGICAHGDLCICTPIQKQNDEQASSPYKLQISKTNGQNQISNSSAGGQELLLSSLTLQISASSSKSSATPSLLLLAV